MSDNSHKAEEFDVQQHSLRKSIILHLLPGVFILAVYIIGARFANQLGLPTLFMLYLAIAVVLIPFELGYILYQGKKQTGRFSLKGIVLYHEPMPWWQYIVIFIPLLVWGFILYGYMAEPVDGFIFKKLFFWIPRWFFLDEGSTKVYSKLTLLVFWGFYFVFNISGAFVEELYFRGFLLPRISRLGVWAPMLNTVMFSVYHFFTPSENVTRILALLPMVYVVWWKKNIKISIILHCGGNAAALISMLVGFLS